MDGYRDQCERFGGGPERLPAWEELRSILERRSAEGWRFEIINPETDPEAAWCFGLAGAARLVITTVEGGRFHLYSADRDEDQFLDGTGLERWLDEHEHEHAGFTKLQEELLGYTSSSYRLLAAVMRSSTIRPPDHELESYVQHVALTLAAWRARRCLRVPGGAASPHFAISRDSR